MDGKGSHYVTTETARRAVALLAPTIEAACRDRSVVGSGFVYLVVMDPGRTPAESSFEDAILYEHAFGNEAEWDADYRRFAREKARLAWTSGMDNHAVQALAPHRLRRGDSLLWGGVCLDGIVVGASGAFPWFDEAFAGAVALTLRALAKGARNAETAALRLGG